MAGKKKGARKNKKPCPGSPKAFFVELDAYQRQWLMWAAEVDSCWSAKCGTDDAKKGLTKVCKAFAKWAKEAKEWGDEVEACFQANCAHPPDHTKPPPPPFDE